MWIDFFILHFFFLCSRIYAEVCVSGKIEQGVKKGLELCGTGAAGRTGVVFFKSKGTYCTNVFYSN